MGQRGTLADHLPTAVCSDALLTPLTLAISLTPAPELGCASSFCPPTYPPSPTSSSLCWNSFYKSRPGPLFLGKPSLVKAETRSHPAPKAPTMLR